MSSAEEELAGRIARRLDHGLTDIDQRAVARLRAARENALERVEPEPAWSMAVQGGRLGAAAGDPLHAFSLRRLASIGALIAALCGMVYWQHLQHDEDLVDIDAKLLSGDLPIDAYLDKGLDAWLTR